MANRGSKTTDDRASRVAPNTAPFHGAAAEEEDADGPLAMHRISLRFVDDEVEHKFSRRHLERSMRVIRMSIFSGMLLYAAFGFLDTYIVADVIGQVWLIRYGIVCPILTAIVLATFTPIFQRYAQAFLSLSMIASGLGIIAMTAIAERPGAYLYYAGLILVVIYCSSLIRLSYVYASAISIGLFLAYQVVALFVNPIPEWALLNNDFFLFVSISIGIFSSYVQELYFRRAFANEQLLRREKARSEELLEESLAANKAKSEFLAIMSHELRTPLNAIIGFSELMSKQIFGPLGSERYHSYAEDINASGTHLLSIINGILDLSKAEAGKLKLDEERVDLIALIDQCLRMFRTKAAQRGVRLAFVKPADAPCIYADQRLLRQIVINLLSNAIKFTDQGGSVSISIGRQPSGELAVIIEDSGIGIAEGDLAKVVEPFVQVESAFNREHEGTGLGLPLVYKIVELHGGRLEIRSMLGAGTTVVVHLPPARVIAPEAARTRQLSQSA